MQIIFTAVIIYMVFFLLFIVNGPNLAIGMEPLVLEGSSYPIAITKGEYIVVNLTLNNLGKLPIENIDIQIVSPGFETTLEKKWPAKIFGNSSISGHYVMKSIDKGTFPIYASVSYFINDTSKKLNEIKYLSKSINVDEVIVSNDFEGLVSPFWQGVATTTLGGFSGLIISKITEYISNKRKDNNEYIKNKERFKSLLMAELKENLAFIRSTNNNEKLYVKNWELIKNDGLYSFCTIKEGLEDDIINLYADYRIYNEKKEIVNESLINRLKELMEKIYTSVESL